MLSGFDDKKDSKSLHGHFIEWLCFRQWGLDSFQKSRKGERGVGKKGKEVGREKGNTSFEICSFDRLSSS